MEKVKITVEGATVDFTAAKKIAAVVAAQENEFSSLVSWCDNVKKVHSPQCLKCEIEGEPGWEVFGRNHEGRLRISFNDDLFVFIHS